MAEVKRKPHRITMEGPTYGYEIVGFDSEHSLGDIARWLLENKGEAEDIYYILKEELNKDD